MLMEQSIWIDASVGIDSFKLYVYSYFICLYSQGCTNNFFNSHMICNQLFALLYMCYLGKMSSFIIKVSDIGAVLKIRFLCDRFQAM